MERRESGNIYASGPMADHLEGIAAADDRLGVPFPLPAAALSLVRWVEVHAVGEVGVEVVWNLDDTRSRAPGRLALYAGPQAPPDQPRPDWMSVEPAVAGGHRVSVRTAPLQEAQASLRPVTELTWEDGPFRLRLTAQGPWDPGELLQIVASVPSRADAARPPV